MRTLKLMLVALVWQLSLLPLAVAAQDAELQERYEQALQAAESRDFERAYDLSVKLVRANMLFYEANVLRIALATILKKSGTEAPETLLIVLKRVAPAGSNPERDVKDLTARLTGAASNSVPAPASPAATAPPQPERGQGSRPQSERLLTQTTPAPASTLPNGRYFALVIGNNRYPNLSLDRQLKTAINDAQEVAKLLRASYGFEVRLLTDAKRAEIIKALNEYRRTLQPDDHLLLYYAGHGHFDKATEKAYWIPTDAEESDNANWIIADDVTANVKAIPARHILIVSDSCYSGTLTRAGGLRMGAPAERSRYLEKMNKGTARLLMASGGNEPVADGGGGGHSIFARALLDGLRRMSERMFTAEELFHQYIRERVAGRADQTPEYNPLRNSGHEEGDFVFVRKP